MPTSAERRRAGGFTLLEVMAAVAVLALLILPILKVREQCYARAYRASRMMAATDHAERLLVKAMATAEEYQNYEAPVEEDPTFHSLLTLEEFDVSTGLTADEAEERGDGEDAAAGFGSGGIAAPGDAGVPDDEQEDRDDPHVVRRFRVIVSWPSWDGEDEMSSDQVELEGYLPMVWEREQESEANR